MYLEVKCLITAENQDKAAKLVTKSFDRLSLSCASRT